MGDYVRKYPESPTAEEIKIGYAPSTIRGTPFIKFLFWTFGSLAVTYGIGYGSYLVLDAVEKNEQARYERRGVVKPLPWTGYQLQPSKQHEILDWEDMNILNNDYAAQLKAKKWVDDPRRPGKVTISADTVSRTAAGIRQSSLSIPTTAPAAN